MTLNAFDKTNFNALIPNLEAGQKADSEKLQAFLTDAANYFETLRNIFTGTTAGDSGAHNVGSDAISGVTGATVYAQLVNLKAQIDQVVSQGVADGSITELKLAAAVATKLNQIATATMLGKVIAGTSLQIGADGTLNVGFAYPRIAQGAYTGDGTTGRQITVGFDPKLVIIYAYGLSWNSQIVDVRLETVTTTEGYAYTQAGVPYLHAKYSYPILAAGGFKVSGNGGTGDSNQNGKTHKYIALG